jgi:large subunit ribosomal protein L6
MKADINAEITIPEGVTLTVEKTTVKAQGPKGTVERKLSNPKVKLSVEGNTVKLFSEKATKREKTLIGTFKAHLNNMFKGVTEGHSYKLKICQGHFPMNVTYGNGVLTIKNFLGEAHPRTVKIKEGADVKVQGSDIIVESPNIELAGQVAADIETATKIKNKDRRVFQDGIYIVDKRGKKV